jgi:hypothetical protein
MISCRLFWIAPVALIAACALVPLACRITEPTGASADPADLLPLDNDISGFARKGSASIMTDNQTIFNAIDGDAQVYIDNKFMEGVKQMYSNGGIDIDVQVFKHENETWALKLYDRFRPTSPTDINTAAAKAVIDNGLPNGYVILYERSSIFMRVTTTQKTDFALNMAKQFYRNIDNKISIQ